jgi:hypothetical protein
VIALYAVNSYEEIMVLPFPLSVKDPKQDTQDDEKGRQLRSRLANIPNVPQRVHLRVLASPAASVDDLFDHPVKDSQGDDRPLS